MYFERIFKMTYGIFYNGDDDSLNDIKLSQVEPLSSVYILDKLYNNPNCKEYAEIIFDNIIKIPLKVDDKVFINLVQKYSSVNDNDVIFYNNNEELTINNYNKIKLTDFENNGLSFHSDYIVFNNFEFGFSSSSAVNYIEENLKLHQCLFLRDMRNYGYKDNLHAALKIFNNKMIKNINNVYLVTIYLYNKYGITELTADIINEYALDDDLIDFINDIFDLMRSGKNSLIKMVFNPTGNGEIVPLAFVTLKDINNILESYDTENINIINSICSMFVNLNNVKRRNNISNIKHTTKSEFTKFINFVLDNNMLRLNNNIVPFVLQDFKTHRFDFDSKENINYNDIHLLIKFLSFSRRCLCINEKRIIASSEFVPILEIHIKDKLLLSLINSKYYIEEYCKYFNRIFDVKTIPNIHRSDIIIVKQRGVFSKDNKQILIDYIMNNREIMEKECKKLKIKGQDESREYRRYISIIQTIDEEI